MRLKACPVCLRVGTWVMLVIGIAIGFVASQILWTYQAVVITHNARRVLMKAVNQLGQAAHNKGGKHK